MDNLNDIISLYSNELAEMKKELSLSQADAKIKNKKKKRFEIFQMLQKKLLQLHQPDLFFEIAHQAYILEKKDSELDGLFVLIELKPDAKKFGKITFSYMQ